MTYLKGKKPFWKKHLYTFAVLFLLFFLSNHTVFGQINNNRFRVDLNSLDMGPCGGANDAHSEVEVLAKNNTVNNFEVAFDLPDGVNFIPGTEIILFQQGSLDYTLTVVDMSDLNAPVFRIERPSDANWEVADLIRFRFDKTASCNAVQFSYTGGLFKDSHTITYNDLNGPQSASDIDPTINTYNFLSAYLAVQNYNSVNSSIGSTVTRNLEVTNSGNGNTNSIIHNVQVGSDLANYSLSFNGNVLTPVVTGNLYTYAIDLAQAPFSGAVGDGDNEFENETIVFEESFIVQGCTNVDVSHQPTWGCSSAEICQTPMPFSGVVLLDTQPPSITITKINPPGATDLCIPTTYTANIANTATTGIAYNVEINTGFGYTTYVRTTPTSNGLWGNDFPNNTKSIANFRFSGQPEFTPDRKPVTHHSGIGTAGSYFIPKDFFSSDPDGPGGLEDLDGDGFYDDMAAGESTDLLYDYSNNTSKASCGTSIFDYVRAIQVIVDGYAQSQCDDYTTTYRRFMNNTVFRRGSVLTDVPTDIYNASPFTVGIQAYLSTYGTDPARCNGQTLFSADPNSIYTVTLNVPNGISLNGTPADFVQVDATTIVYSTSNLPTSNILNMNIEFPLMMDCDVYSGPLNMPMTYTTRFECSCFAEDIACGSIEGIRAKCGAECDGPQITLFEAERETAGWTDDSMSTKVILDPNVHTLDTYMAKDEMVIRANGIMNNSNPNNLFLDITYRPGAGGMDIINYASGTLMINDLSSAGNVSTALTAPPIVIDDGGGNYRLRLDLTGYTSLISPTYNYGEPSAAGGLPEADEVFVELHYVFEEDFTTSTLYELSNFTGEFFALDALGGRISCTNIGERVRYFKNYVNPYDRNVTTAIGCNTTYVETLIQSSSVGIDRFPSEYRPPFVLQSTTVEIPVGAEFTGVVIGYDYSGTDPTTANGGLIANVVGNTVVITPGASLREYDQGAAHYPRLRTYFRGGSSSPASTPISWTTDYEEFSYSNASVNKSKTETQSFNFTPPSYVFTSPTPIVSGDQATAIFDVEMCKMSTSVIDYNWLQISNGSDFTVLNAYEVNGTVETPINFTTGTGATWVEVGQFTTGINVCKTIRFEIDFVQCSNFDFTVENGWGCEAYPSDFSVANYQELIDLSLEPKEAALQIAILDEPNSTVDICSNFNIDIELRNAGNGDLITPGLSFDIPGDATSLLLNDITLEYPRNSGNIQSITYTLLGNTVTLNLLNHSVLAGFNGIQGSINATSIDDQIAIVQLDLSVQCNFTSNTAITYEAIGNNNCGTASTGSGSRLSTNPIIVTGADPSYDAISTISVPTGGIFASCTTEKVTIETTIVGGPTSNLDYALIILPEGLSFDAASFVSNNPAYPVTYTSSSTVGNHEEFIINMPNNANNGANPSYSFDVTPTNTITSCSPGTQIEVFNFVVTSALVCGPITCGTTEIAAGGTFENVSIIKPELMTSSFTPNADYTTDGAGNYEYGLQFGIENTGTVDIASGFVYDIYCLDGVGSKTGASIYTGTINQAIAAGNSITDDIVFTSTNFCGDSANMIIEFVPSATNCHCDILSIPLVSEPEVADLEVTSTVSQSNVNIGDTVTFTIEVLNNGLFDAENVILENIVPIGYTVTGINDGGTQTGNTITWPQFNLANTNTSTFSFTATVNTPTGTANEFANVSQVVSVDQFDSDSTPDNFDGLPLEDDESIVTVHVLNSDLSVTKGLSTSSSTEPTIGETVTYEVILSNLGPDAANTIRIEDRVPSGLTVNAATISNGGVLSGSTIIWNIASLNTGTNLVLTYDAIVNIPTSETSEFTNIAEVIAVDEFDPNSTPNNYDPNRALENDEAVYVLRIQTADLELLNTIVPTTADPGDSVVVSVEITNDGPNDATNIGIQNIVPPGLSVTNISDSGVQLANTITWNISNIPNGTSFILTFEATVNNPTNMADEFLNTAEIIAVDQYDLDSQPNNDDGDQSEDDEDNALLMPIAADLSLSKGLSATSNDAPNTGETVTFELLLTNVGPDIATNVTIEDLVPSGYTIGAINDGGLLNGSTITWIIPEVIVGTQTFTYEATINTPTNAADEYTNVAQVTTVDQFDPNSSPNNDDGDQSENDEASFTIGSPTVDLEITKTADKIDSFFGDNVEFTITVTNLSGYEATNIGIEDALPNGFALVEFTVDTGVYDEAIITWDIPSLATGASATLSMIVTVTDVEAYTNIAELAYVDQIDDNISNDRDEVTISVTQEECLTVFNEFSPNNDGANDFFFIECLENYPKNMLQVFNRWGIKVFEMKGYDNSWDGTSTGRATIDAKERLPVGTYYYTLDPGDGTTKHKAGWLYITR